jgi:hypothetical protein
VLALIVPHLDLEALERFTRHLKPVFVDEYATVPNLSVERMLALHRDGRLDVKALGADHRVDTRGSEAGVAVTIAGERTHFPYFIEATGQRALDADAFPFPTLLDQGVVAPTDQDEDGHVAGIGVDAAFHPATGHPAADRLFCLSIPFLLSRHPFIQGITSSHEMGGIVGAALAEGLHVVGAQEAEA